ncbi:MAG: hypothetical protein R8K53_06975 [Mariprofundaceae bacterium]
MFVREVASKNARIKEILNHFIEGFILQNTLLMRDIDSAHMKFKNLEVFIDTGVLLGALGFKGETPESAARESFLLLRNTGAYLSVFDKTIDETRNILALYEHKLATTTGKKALWPNDVTHYFISKNYTPSDVRQAISLLEENIRNLGLTIKKTPPRTPKHTYDETSLADALKGNGDHADGPRINHDVDCVAAVLTKRKGQKSEKIEYAVAIFSSASGRAVRNIQTWYTSQVNGQSIPPVIDHLALTNIAWLKNPTLGKKARENEFMALCYSLIRPEKRVWKRFIGHLDQLQKENRITSDESIAIVANSLTVPLLIREISDEQGSDADTFDDVIERVKYDYKQESLEQIDLEKNKSKKSGEALRGQRLHLLGLAKNISSGITWLIASLIVYGAVYGLILTIPSIMNPDEAVSIKDAAAISLYVVLALVSLVFGLNIKGLRESAQLRLKDRIHSILVADKEYGDT